MTNFNDPLVFKRFGINHLSPSHIGEFVTMKSMWVMKRGFNYSDGIAPHMIRGEAIGKGLGYFLNSKPNNIDDVVEFVEQYYDARYLDTRESVERSDEIQNVRLTLRPITKCGVDELNGIGNFVQSERKLELEVSKLFNDERFPNLIAYTDFTFAEDKGNEFTVELKCPTKKTDLKYRHLFQGFTAYHYGQNNINPINDSRILFLLPRKSTDRKTKKVTHSAEPDVHYLKDYVDQFHYQSELKGVYNSMMNILTQCQTWHDVAKLCPPNPDDWYWNKESIKMRREIWGI